MTPFSWNLLCLKILKSKSFQELWPYGPHWGVAPGPRPNFLFSSLPAITSLYYGTGALYMTGGMFGTGVLYMTVGMFGTGVLHMTGSMYGTRVYHFSWSDYQLFL